MKKIIPYILIVVALLIAGGIYIDSTSKTADNLKPGGYRQPKKINLADSGKPAQAKLKTGQGETQMPKIDFNKYGAAPNFTGISHWLNGTVAECHFDCNSRISSEKHIQQQSLNSDPLTIEQLKGKVVLIDFWTYSCINCIRTLPYVTKWYDTYQDQGLVVVGVHTPEFAFEKVTDNVATAIKRFKINYPVAQDNDYATWQAYNNHYWPAEYLIDKNGQIVYEHFGEGNYDHTEDAIRILLGMDKPVAKDNGKDLSGIRSPEMYFELPRLTNLAPEQTPSLSPKPYTLPPKLELNKFALEGNWCFDSEKASLCGPGPGKIKLHFSSGKVFMVAAADKPITLKIKVDGSAQPDVAVQMSDLYTLFDSNQYNEHEIEITIPEAGFEAFTFTFG